MAGLRAALLLMFVIITHACTTPARPVGSKALQDMLPFIEDGITTRQELGHRLGTPDWREVDGRVSVYRMSSSSGQDLQPGWRYADPDDYYHFELIVAFDAENRVRAHSLVVRSHNGERAQLHRSDVESLPADAVLDDVLLRFGRPHQKRGDGAGDVVVVYGWGKTQGDEYEYGGGNVAGGFLVLQVDPQHYQVRRRYIVDRHRWEDNLNEGVKQTIRYWRFLDRAPADER